MRKTHDKEMRTLKLSMATEIEMMTTNFSNASRDLIAMNHRYEELDKKFKMYYLKSDKYIKEREAKLEELQAECDHLAEEYGRFDNLFNEERKANNILRDQLKRMTEEFDKSQQLSHKRYLEIIDYEQRYRGIDITKLHEQIEYLKCKIHETQLYEREYEAALVKIRDMIYAIRDDKESHGLGDGAMLRSLKKRAAKWQGNLELEEICSIFTRYITTPTVRTTERIRAGELKEDGVTKADKQPKTPVKDENKASTI